MEALWGCRVPVGCAPKVKGGGRPLLINRWHFGLLSEERMKNTINEVMILSTLLIFLISKKVKVISHFVEFTTFFGN